MLCCLRVNTESVVEKVFRAENGAQSDNVVEIASNRECNPTMQWKRQHARRTLTWFDLTVQWLDRLVPTEKEASTSRAVWRTGGGKCGLERKCRNAAAAPSRHPEMKQYHIVNSWTRTTEISVVLLLNLIIMPMIK
jgi:hypothetical protein